LSIIKIYFLEVLSMDSIPSLIEPGTKFFLNQTLKQCHIIKNKYYNTIFNIGLLVALIAVVGLILLYKYKGKLTPAEKLSKDKKKQQYILSKIKQVQESKRRSQQELITGLPNWDNDNEAFLR
jgi:hypothetical protein